MQLDSDHPTGVRPTIRDPGPAPLHRPGPALLLEPPQRPRGGPEATFREDVGHAAAETYLVTGLAFTLLGYLG
jgi:hypothetical protein